MIVEDPVGCFFNALGVSLPDLDLDLDLDGDPDVAFALGDTTECPASFQSGNRLFENLYLQEQVFGPLTTVSPSFSLDEGRAAAGDIDDDGFDDVVVIDLDPTIFINEWGEAFATVGGVKYSNGDGSFGSASVLDLDNYGLPSGVAALEPIGPGGEQIVLTGGIEHTLRIVDRSTSPASITLLDQTVAGYFPMAPVTGDVDGDYVDDIMWASSGELRTLRSTVGFDMPPTVTSVADPAFVNPGFVKELRLADLNGDFNQDLVALVVPPAIVIPLPPEVHVFQWTDDCADPWEFIGCFEGVSILLPVQCEPTAIAVGQLVVPPAGLPLELVVGCASGELEVYSFAFDFSFSPPTELRPAALNVSGLAVLDFNIDSASDIAVIGNGTTAGAGKRDVFYYGTGGTWRHRALSKDTDGGIAVLLGDFAMSPGLETVFVGSTELRHVPIVAGIVPP